jgi:predicted nucleic acid-binding protein
LIVYVETNFLVELAYLQERYESCQEILDLSRSSQITVALPAFSVAEARATLTRRASERKSLKAELDKHLYQIARSESFRTLIDDSRHVVSALLEGTEEARRRMERAVVDLERNIVPLTAEVIFLGYYFELTQSLTPQDALVLASVASDARNRTDEKVFVSQDAKAFSSDSVQEELGRDFKILTNFDDALGYIKSRLGSQNL